MIAVIDYGVGNLFSLCGSLKKIGAEAIVTADPEVIHAAEKLILPGVGAFGDAADKLHQTGLDRIVQREAADGKSLLGICLGMQLLFESSTEYGYHEGLGLLKGNVTDMNGRLPKEMKIPHIGWNGLHITKPSRILGNTKEGDFVYFVHSFFAENCDDSLAATTEYGIPLTAAVERGNVMGCQFHPEKSGSVGLNILRAFCGEDKT